MDDQIRRRKAADSLRAALEVEFEWIHQDLPETFPSHGTPEERADALGKCIDALSGDQQPTALCLSGGGIRSATFCLGALQGLAQVGLLGKFHYLSTVSGGGYIGGWLSSWIHRSKDGVAGVEEMLRRSANRPAIDSRAGAVAVPKESQNAEEQAPIDRLRAYTNYLSPVWGLSLDALTLVATFMRNLALHWAVLLPFLFLVVLIPRIGLVVQHHEPSVAMIELCAAIAVLLIIRAIAYIASDLPGPLIDGRALPRSQFSTRCLLPLVVASILMSWSIKWTAIKDQHPTCQAASQPAPTPAPGGAVSDTVAPLVLEPLWTTLGCVSQKHIRGAVIENGKTSAALLALAGAIVHVIGAGVGWSERRRRGLQERRYTYPKIALLTAVATGAFGGLGLFAYLRFVLSRIHSGSVGFEEAWTILSVPALLLIFWSAVAFHVGLSRRLTTDEDREWWSRAAAASLGVTMGWLALFTVVLCLPAWALEWLGLQENGKSLTGGTTALGVLGAVISGIGFWSKRGGSIVSGAETLASRVGLRLLDLAAMAFIVLLFALLSLVESRAVNLFAPSVEQAVARQVALDRDAFGTESRCKAGCGQRLPNACSAGCAGEDPESPRAGQVAFHATLVHSPIMGLLLSAAGLLLVGLGATYAIGVNTFSLQRMYGNRLVRAYLGATHSVRIPHWFTGFDPNDDVSLADVEPPTRSGRLFHVINCAINLSKPAGDRLEWQQRKAASFTFTPQHCGTPDQGYAPTTEWGKARADGAIRETAVGQHTPGTTLGRAVAISGAAASPNMGYHTSKVVAFAMSFFNVRLGRWLPNTSDLFRDLWLSDEPDYGLISVLSEATANTSDDTPFVYLSDGGHFENLGLYEMVRRRCRRIVVIDATEDPAFEYSDLEDSIRKIRVDLGADVSFRNGLPTHDSVRLTRRHFAVGTVDYGSGTTGLIVYIKPALDGNEPLDVQRYAQRAAQRKGPVFPHDPTSHQAFDEAQFESYRMLGLYSVVTTFQDDSWEFGDPAPVPGPGNPGGMVVPPTMNAAAMQPRQDGWLDNAGKLTAAAVLSGALGVAGTVALKPSEVALKDTHLTLDAAPLRLQASQEDLDAVRRLGEAAHRLADSMASVSTAIVDRDPGAMPASGATGTEPSRDLVGSLNSLEAALSASGLRDSSIRVQVDALDRQITAIRAQVLLLLAKPTELQVSPRLTVALSTLAEAIGRWPPPGEQRPRAEDVQALLNALNGIRNAVAETSPRRNVSGTSEAGRK